jgi:uncharacterized protein (TIGR03382 family)
MPRCPPQTAAIAVAVTLALVPGAATAAARVVSPEVISVRPHDATAYTQGLILHEGALYESTGHYGRSTLRKVDPLTGAVLRQVDLESTLFGEGLARVGNRLYQLTWQERVAIVWDLETFTEVRRLTYDGEGWGLCFDGNRLVTSDGSDQLTFRDPESFAVTGGIAVTLDARPLTRLNELECVGRRVWANVWTTDTLVEIDPETGAVLTLVQAPNLVPPQRNPDAVLNGIAYDPATGRFLITGKFWPSLFEVHIPQPTTGARAPDGCDATSGGLLAVAAALAVAGLRRRRR